MIYAVSAFTEEHGQEMLANINLAKEKVGSIEVYEKYAPNFFLVSFKGTSLELGEILGLSDEGEKTGIIVRMGMAFSGYAGRDMWEWIDVKGRNHG